MHISWKPWKEVKFDVAFDMLHDKRMEDFIFPYMLICLYPSLTYAYASKAILSLISNYCSTWSKYCPILYLISLSGDYIEWMSYFGVYYMVFVVLLLSLLEFGRKKKEVMENLMSERKSDHLRR
jgi:hypothetical protein